MSALLALLLAGAAPQAAPPAPITPVAAVSESRQVLWQPIVEMGGELYPSFLVATATMEEWGQAPRMLESGEYFGDALGMLGATVRAPRAGARVRLEVSAPGLSEPSSVEAVLPVAGAAYELFPRMAYHYDALEQRTQPTTVNVTYRLYVDGMMMTEQRRPVRVRSLNDVPLWEVNRANQQVDYTWMFAAFVNENHPWVDALLREALNAGAIDQFVGYQRDAGEVYRQVYAVWNVFQRRGFKYSNITQASGAGRRVVSQHVRSLEDAVQTSQANCVDGSVLFASVLRKIGIDPVLVLLPGHMVVGFYTDAEHRNFSVLETTMLGTENLANYTEDNSLGGAIASMFGVETRNQ
ncbi:MAG: hypothetical protein ICV87_12180, partial [Gemmatimonadetes bacterium]|nr:hypothetical protein [Gemmatimonadota bacterium]